jgi:hypothetical protein
MINIIRTTIIIAVVGWMSCSDASAQKLVDDSKLYKIVMVDPTSNMEDWFADHAGLRTLSQRCMIHRFKSTDTLFRARYAKSMPSGSASPAIIFTRPDSGVLYLATADTLPSSADQLYDEMQSAYRLAGEGPHADKVESTGMVAEDRPLIDTARKLGDVSDQIADLSELLRSIKSDTLLWIAIAVLSAITLSTFIPRPNS